jgi:hypothetical protein
MAATWRKGPHPPLLTCETESRSRGDPAQTASPHFSSYPSRLGRGEAVNRWVWVFAFREGREGAIGHGCPTPFYDGVVGGMAACGVWSVLVSRSGYCSMA